MDRSEIDYRTTIDLREEEQQYEQVEFLSSPNGSYSELPTPTQAIQSNSSNHSISVIDQENCDETQSNQDNGLHTVKVLLFTREFCNQRNGVSVGSALINCDDNTDFFSKLVAAVKPYLKKEILISLSEDASTRSYKWANNSEYGEADLERFILIQDKAGKKSYRATEVTKKKIETWSTMCLEGIGINCFIQVMIFIVVMMIVCDEKFFFNRYMEMLCN